jgi:hypothetical protein
VDPTLGAKTELAKITDTSIATLPFTTENNQESVEAAMLFLANGLISTNYNATIAAGSVYDSTTNIWTGKYIVTSRTVSDDTATDSADRTITIIISVDPTLGAKTELAKITDTSIATLPFTTINIQSEIESAMISLANAIISTDYAVTIAPDSTYDTATKVWTGKFIVTNKTVSTNTFTDITNRAIAIIISAPFEIPSNSEISKVEVPASVTDPKVQFVVTGNQTTTNKEITVDDSLNTGMTIVFPAGTTITGPAGWDGVMELPRPSTATLTIPGYSTNIDSVIEVGLGSASLTFDKAVRLNFPNEAGKRIGFMRDGVFTEITTLCVADAIPVSANECKDAVGADAFVLTNHFTKFIAYTQTENSFGGGGGGGSSYSDITAPVISEIKVTAGTNSAVVAWKTNEASLSTIIFGTTTSYGQESKNTVYNTVHTVTINNLLPNTTYHFQIKSEDSSKNTATSTDQTFSTSDKKVIGDLNNDSKVDKYDFSLMMSNWGKTGTAIGDLNNDSKVDKYDFSLMMSNWNK